MATIIPYNSWREQLAANILGPLIGNMIQRSQQANQNRKLNALRGVIEQELGSMAAPQMTPQLTPSNYNSNGWQSAFHSDSSPLAQFNDATSSIAPNVSPQTAYVPTQVDIQNAIARNIATKRFSMLDPKLVQEAMTPYLQAAEAARMENRRNEVGQSLMNAADATARRNQAWNAYGQGLLPIDAVNAAQSQLQADRPQPFTLDTGGSFARGTFDPVTGTFSDQNTIAKTLSPQQAQQGTQWQQTFDYNAQKDARDFAENQRRFDTTQSFNQAEADRNYGLRDRQLTEAETQGAFTRNNTLPPMIYGGKGTYKYNPVTGEFDEMKTPDGQPIITYGKTGSNGNISSQVSYAKTRLTGLQNQLRDAKKRLDNANITLNAYSNDQGSPEYKRALENVQNIEAEIKQTQTEIDNLTQLVQNGIQYGEDNTNTLVNDWNNLSQQENKIKALRDKETDPQKIAIYDKKLQEIQTYKNTLQEIFNGSGQSAQTNNSQNNSLGSMFLGSNYGGNLTPGKKYGAPRQANPKLNVKAHNHKGIDLEAKHGSPISAHDILGDNVKVVSILNNPAGSGLGCNVKLEGTVNGKKYGYVMGHLKEGSIKVQPGQIIKPETVIGEVGNTGNSSGPHLHFEVKEGGINGNNIDPENFFAEYNTRQSQQNNTPSLMPQNPDTEANNQSQQTQQTPQSQPAHAPVRNINNPYATAKWINQSTGETISHNGYLELWTQAENGQIKGIHSERDLDRYLKEKGYIPAEIDSYDTVPFMTPPPPTESNDITSPDLMPGFSSSDVTPDSPQLSFVSPDERPEQQQAQIDYLNGLDGSNTGLENPYWGIFQQPYNFGTIFDNAQDSQYNKLRRRYPDRYTMIY